MLQLVGELNLMPILVLACRMCPKNIEATMYAMLMSTINFGKRRLKNRIYDGGTVGRSGTAADGSELVRLFEALAFHNDYRMVHSDAAALGGSGEGRADPEAA